MSPIGLLSLNRHLNKGFALLTLLLQAGNTIRTESTIKNSLLSLYLTTIYSPKWRWLAGDIYRAAKRRAKYPTLATDTEVNSSIVNNKEA